MENGMRERYVLDFLQHGKQAYAHWRAGFRAGAFFMCREEFFTLLEALVKEGLMLKPATLVRW
jgi:hypothetical protein